jgi:alpha-glucoside transport system ATP-binding protein
LANKGIAQVGTPLELYETPQNEFVAQFIGSPAMNLFAGEIVETGAETKIMLKNGGSAICALSTNDSDKGKAVNLGVRPEDLSLTDGDAVLSGDVSYTEALGEVTLIYIDNEAGQDPFIAKLPGIHKNLRGASVRLSADPTKMHVFDAATGLRM